MACLLISCICYNTTSVYPGTVRDDYGTDSSQFCNAGYLNHLSRKVQRLLLCSYDLAVDLVKDRDKEPIFLYNNKEKGKQQKGQKRESFHLEIKVLTHELGATVHLVGFYRETSLVDFNFTSPAGSKSGVALFIGGCEPKVQVLEGDLGLILDPDWF